MTTISSKITITYDLTSGNTPLYIATGGSIAPSANGATGVNAEYYNASLTVQAQGSIIAGAGTGVAGGIGVDLLQVAQVTVDANGIIKGGIGQSGERGGAGVYGAYGGSVSTQTSGSIYGGDGSSGGGAGIEFTGDNYNTYIANHGLIQGGAGLEGSNGGTGVELAAGDAFNRGGLIVGGSGEVGGTGVIVTRGYAYNAYESSGSSRIEGGDGVAGGHGGLGAAVQANGDLTNLGYIRGGIGSDSKSTGTGVYLGGTGVEVDVNGRLDNAGKIYGGTARIGSYVGGTPGVGVYLNGGFVIDDGVIGGARDHTGTPHTYNIGDSVKFGPDTGSYLELSSVALKAGPTQFGTLQGGITGFAVGDTIAIYGTDAGSIKASGSAAAGTYTLTTPDDGTLTFTGKYTNATFSVAENYNNTAAIITLTAACYRRGTLIATGDSEVAIENLQIGDRVLTQSGGVCAIRWIGRRSYSQSALALNRDFAPIRIQAGALNDGIPRRDLWVSPEHAMWIDGMLVPAGALVNGISILADETLDSVDYVHLEFETHEIIYAEGALSESFADDERRDRFDNAAEYRRLYPVSRNATARFCGPRVEEGFELDAVRRRLLARAQPRLDRVA